MTMVTEPPRLTQVLKLEEDPSFCREEVTVLAGSGTDRVLTLGTIIERNGAGKVVALTTSTASPYGVLINTVTAPTTSDVTSVAVVRGPAIVSDLGLIYPPGATASQKTAINTALAGLGIVVRSGV